MKSLALELIRLYQLTISRVMPPSCRFIPTCSQYTYEAISRFGFFKGGWLGAKRLARCHPFHPAGYDPVPQLNLEEKARHSFEGTESAQFIGKQLIKSE